MQTLDKIIRIGLVPVYKSRAELYCHVQIKDGILSISGVIGPMINGSAKGGSGQIEMEFAHRNPAHNDKRYSNPIQPNAIQFAPGWTKDLWLEFLEIWHNWHLNNMRAACEHQRALGWTWETHPSAVCATCGYKLGHSWLKEELPQAVIGFLDGLPNSDKTPAWV